MRSGTRNGFRLSCSKGSKTLDQKHWAGIFPAITTPFQADLSVDYDTFAAQARWLIECGCDGIVALGSLGEAPTLDSEEKIEILKHARKALDGKAPLIAGIAALSTAEAVWLAQEAHRVGADGLMVLPPQIYRSDWRETQAHLSAVFAATPLSCMLYNNPVAYGTDITPLQMIELRARHHNFHAVKESSGDRWRFLLVWMMSWSRV
jgi:dihydrodipicolinate synthase/N-acetylneuraminate lyase